MSEGVDKLVYDCSFATDLETRLRQVLKYDLDTVEYELNNAVEGLRDGFHDDGEGHWNGLRQIFTDEEDENGWPIRKEEQNEDAGEFVILSNRLASLSVTEMGMFDDQDDSDVIGEWEDVEVRCVKWLNEKSQEQMALVHGTVSLDLQSLKADADSSQVWKQRSNRHQVLQPRCHSSSSTLSSSLRLVSFKSRTFVESSISLPEDCV